MRERLWIDPVVRRLAGLAQACARRPWLTLGLAAAVVLLCAVGAARNIAVNTDSSEMLSSELDFRQRQLALNRAFPGLQNRLVVVVRAPSADAADLFLLRLTRAIGEREGTLKNPFAASVDPYFQRNGLLYLEDAELDATLARISRAAPLIGTLAVSPTAHAYFGALAQGLRDAARVEGGEEALAAAVAETAATIEGRLEGSPRPLPWSRLFRAQDGPLVQRVLTVEPRLDFGRLQPARPAIDALRGAVTEARAHPALAGVEVGVTGDPALRGEELASVLEGLWASLAVSVVSVGAVVWLAFRSARRAAITAGVVVFALAVTAAFGAVAFEAFNLVSVGFAVLLVGLGADYATHTLLRADEALEGGAGPFEAVRETMGELVLPLMLCALSTAIGFLAFVPTPFVGMAQLGMLGAVGVLCAFLASITLVPAGIALLGRPRPRVRVPLAGGARWRPAAARLLLGAVLLSCLALPLARFNADPMGLRDPDAPSVRAYDLLFEDPASQPYRASVLAPDLAAAQRIAERARGLPGVESAITLGDLLPGEEADFRRDAIDAVAFGVLPQLEGGSAGSGGGIAELREALRGRSGEAERRLAHALDRLAAARDPERAQALERDLFLFWPMRLGQLRAQLEPDFEIAAEDLPPALRARFVNEAGQARVEIAPEADLRDRDARARFVDTLGRALPGATGPVFNVERAGEVVGRAMLTAFAGTCLAVGLVLFLVWRDAAMTLATLAPVLGAAALTVAASVALGQPFNYANVIALPLLIGTGVDSAIHYAARATNERGVDAVPGTSTPRAVLFSALTTIASAGSLMLSPHRGVASIGLLLTVALGATVLTTLLLQPMAIRAVERRRGRVQRVEMRGTA